MIKKSILDSMQILSKAKQLDPYRMHIEKLNNCIVDMDERITKALLVIDRELKRLK